VIDCPLSEAGYIGAASAASVLGLRVIAELMFNDFIWLAGDQLFNGAAKLRYLTSGKQTCKLTIRTVTGGGLNAGMHHSQSLYALAAHVPGVKAVVPATPYDAKGILIAAIRDDDPVLVFENKALYNIKGPVPEEAYEVPIGKAKVVRPGNDVTVVTISRMLYVALEAAEILEKQGISVEVIDCVSIAPLDEDTIIQSVSKTEHLVIVDEANGRCGVAADIAALAADKAIDRLDGPIQLVTAASVPVPFSPTLEKAYLPDADKVIVAAMKSMG
jgi:pyruvate dehydrogenase E1 component beta subunit